MRYCIFTIVCYKITDHAVCPFGQMTAITCSILLCECTGSRNQNDKVCVHTAFGSGKQHSSCETLRGREKNTISTISQNITVVDNNSLWEH